MDGDDVVIRLPWAKCARRIFEQKWAKMRRFRRINAPFRSYHSRAYYGYLEHKNYLYYIINTFIDYSSALNCPDLRYRYPNLSRGGGLRSLWCWKEQAEDSSLSTKGLIALMATNYKSFHTKEDVEFGGCYWFSKGMIDDHTLSLE